MSDDADKLAVLEKLRIFIVVSMILLALYVAVGALV
jgi:hypothetical protein